MHWSKELHTLVLVVVVGIVGIGIEIGAILLFNDWETSNLVWLVQMGADYSVQSLKSISSIFIF